MAMVLPAAGEKDTTARQRRRNSRLQKMEIAVVRRN
jgi:hypothetical protein